MPQDERALILERLLAAHEAWFDVSQGCTYAGRDFDGYAEFRSTGQKYVLTKKATLWEVNAFEYLFFKLEDRLTCAGANGYIDFMCKDALKKVKPEKDHMSSFVSLVIIAGCCEEGVSRIVRKARFRKNFALGFRGWADLRLAVIDLEAREVLANAAAKNMKATLSANAGFDGGAENARRVKLQ